MQIKSEYLNQAPNGRQSVRIQSIKNWPSGGLFIADIIHMPSTSTSGGCSTWPAFWTLGTGPWPYNGEIDILEGANNNNKNLPAAHTSNQCSSQQNSALMQGLSTGNTNCDYFLSGGATNGVGCTAQDPRTTSFGTGFNQNGGGVYAMEWTPNFVKLWFFPRGALPADINSAQPNPNTWGLPTSIINNAGCNVAQNFANQMLVFDNTFCGGFRF